MAWWICPDCKRPTNGEMPCHCPPEPVVRCERCGARMFEGAEHSKEECEELRKFCALTQDVRESVNTRAKEAKP